MSAAIDLTGRVFGRLTVLRLAERLGQRRAWSCQCQCGEVIVVRGGDLTRRGGTQSCGCLQREKSQSLCRLRNSTHGRTGTAEYWIWHGMIQRCTNPNNPAYHNYGGRGIKVCQRWLVFENFLADMGKRPDGLTLERKENNGDYEPGNCKWATRAEQSVNRRATKLKPLDVHNIRQLNRHLPGLAPATILARAYGVSKAHIQRIVTGRKRAEAGYAELEDCNAAAQPS